MSDFDDEPNVAADASDGRSDGWDDEAPAAPKAKAKPRKSEPDDDWDDDWDDDADAGGGGGKRDLTLVYAIVAAAIVIVLAVVLTRPNDDNTTASDSGGNSGGATTEATLPNKNWQGPVGDAVGENGKDAQARAQSAPGVYIWTDFQGWHLRSNNTQEVKVDVAADQIRVKETDDYNDEDEDGDAAFSTEELITLPAGDGSAGVGLDLGTSEAASFTVTIDGKNVPIEQIFLGGAEGQADQNPVTFVKS